MTQRGLAKWPPAWTTLQPVSKAQATRKVKTCTSRAVVSVTVCGFASCYLFAKCEQRKSCNTMQRSQEETLCFLADDNPCCKCSRQYQETHVVCLSVNIVVDILIMGGVVYQEDFKNNANMGARAGLARGVVVGPVLRPHPHLE